MPEVCFSTPAALHIPVAPVAAVAPITPATLAAATTLLSAVSAHVLQSSAPPPDADSHPDIERKLIEVFYAMMNVQHNRLWAELEHNQKRVTELNDLEAAIGELRQAGANKADGDKLDGNPLDRTVTVGDDSPLRARVQRELEEVNARLQIANGRADMALSELNMTRDEFARLSPLDFDFEINAQTRSLYAAARSSLREASALTEQRDALTSGDITVRDILTYYGISYDTPTKVSGLNVLIEKVKTETDARSRTSQIEFLKLQDEDAKSREVASATSTLQKGINDMMLELSHNI